MREYARVGKVWFDPMAVIYFEVLPSKDLMFFLEGIRDGIQVSAELIPEFFRAMDVGEEPV